MESRKPYIPEWKKYLDSVEAAIMMANTLQWKGRDIVDLSTERAMGWNLDYAAFLSMYLSVRLSMQLSVVCYIMNQGECLLDL